MVKFTFSWYQLLLLLLLCSRNVKRKTTRASPGSCSNDLQITTHACTPENHGSFSGESPFPTPSFALPSVEPLLSWGRRPQNMSSWIEYVAFVGKSLPAPAVELLIVDYHTAGKCRTIANLVHTWQDAWQATPNDLLCGSLHLLYVDFWPHRQVKRLHHWWSHHHQHHGEM